ncbi:MAG: hypothetical protein GY847_18870 [Proteobacteria bacterium]|nr:hypothetical protein [Pseudomonadota bacterium]
MADISKTKTYNIDTEVMRSRLNDLTEEMARKFGIKYCWEGDICRLSGSALKSGVLTLSDSTVTIELTLGLMAKMLKGKIESEIEAKIDKLVNA